MLYTDTRPDPRPVPPFGDWIPEHHNQTHGPHYWDSPAYRVHKAARLAAYLDLLDHGNRLEYAHDSGRMRRGTRAYRRYQDVHGGPIRERLGRASDALDACRIRCEQGSAPTPDTV